MRAIRTIFLIGVILTSVMCASTGGATASSGASGAAAHDTDEAPPARLANISVVRATAALGIEQREPVNVGEHFTLDDERVYAYSEIENGNGTSIRHVYYHDGEQTNEVILTVRADSWRTWSYKTLLPGREGEWRVDIVSQDGRVLDSIHYTVTAE